MIFDNICDILTVRRTSLVTEWHNAIQHAFNISIDFAACFIAVDYYTTYEFISQFENLLSLIFSPPPICRVKSCPIQITPRNYYQKTLRH